MLTIEQQYVLSLLRVSLKGGECEEPVGLDRQKIANIIIRSGILLTVYSQASDEIKKILNSKYTSAVYQSLIQDHYGNIILRNLSQAGVSCIPLKGWELRKIYPSPNMRQMADLDILVTPYNYDIIRATMEKIGFSAGTESSWMHDNFTMNFINVEIHKRLTDDSNMIQQWQKDLWKRATKIDGNLYKMSPEDFIIYHFVHLYKDFLNGSLGLRRIADSWLLKSISVDSKKLSGFFNSFGMETFYERMIKLADVTMGDAPMDEDSEVLLKYAFDNGIYGTAKSYKAGRIAAMGNSVKGGKVKSAIAAVFLPYKRMLAHFPILKKYPILLPFFWIKRIFAALRGNIRNYKDMLDYSNVSEDDYLEVRRFFQAGGVWE